MQYFICILPGNPTQDGTCGNDLELGPGRIAPQRAPSFWVESVPFFGGGIRIRTPPYLDLK